LNDAHDHATLDQALIAAAWRDDVSGAERLIAQGADVNAKDETIQSAYLIATSEGSLDLLELTLANDADIGEKDSYNGTGLIRAADRGLDQIVAALLRAGIDVDHINRLGWTALHEAIILGDGSQRYVDTVRLLLAGGADPSLPSQRDRTTPLSHAESRGFRTIATTLRAVLDAGTLPDASTGAAAAAELLLAAARDGDADRAVIALRAGADATASDSSGQAAVAIAAAGHLDVARFLTTWNGER
jgi:ankyrin repeat protein